MAAVVRLEQVNVVRGDATVLHDVNLCVEAGEQIALLGPNGCGKSTLLKTMTKELYPLAQPGTRVELFGKDRWDLVELRQRLGVVQNDLPGKPFLACTGLEAMLTGFFASSKLWPNLQVQESMRDAGRAVLRTVGAEDLAKRVFGEMSAGQQRRVLIGRALVGSGYCAGGPATLLLDEPSNALDLRAQRELRELLSSLAGAGTTMMLITHQIADIVPEMKRVVLMRDGRIVADGPRQELLTEAALSELFRMPVRLVEIDGRLHAC